jgi:hypothetical protein
MPAPLLSGLLSGVSCGECSDKSTIEKNEKWRRTMYHNFKVENEGRQIRWILSRYWMLRQKLPAITIQL